MESQSITSSEQSLELDESVDPTREAEFLLSFAFPGVELPPGLDEEAFESVLREELDVLGLPQMLHDAFRAALKRVLLSSQKNGQRKGLLSRLSLLRTRKK